MDQNIKAILCSIVAALLIVGLMVALNNHTPLPYDPEDKGFIVENFVRLLFDSG